MKKKRVSRLEKVVLEILLILSLGVAVLITYAIFASSLLLAIDPSVIPSGVVGAVLALVLTHGPLIALCAALCFAMRYVVDIRPWRLGLGSALFAKLCFVLLRWVTGGFDDTGVDGSVLVDLVVALIAGTAGALSAQVAARKVAARIAAQPAPLPVGHDLGEELRRIQQTAQAAAPDAAPPSNPAEPPAAAPEAAAPAAAAGDEAKKA